jgi:putative nucleotidyltransferase with HDIG domain
MGSLTPAVIRERVEQTQELSTLPGVILRIIEVVNNPMADARDVEKEVMEDPVITAKILKVANSSYYGASRDISNISQAVVLMGFAEVQNLALSVSIFSRFSGNTKMFDRREFWEHCFTAAAVADALQTRVDEQINDGFAAGLLHDIGRIVLDQQFPKEFEAIVNEAEAQEISLLDAEKKVLGITHCDVGYWIAEKWNLPKVLTDSILFHHYPVECPESNMLASIIHVADFIARGIGEYMKKELVPPPKDDSAFKLLGLEGDSAANAAELISKKMEYFNILVDPST